MLDIRKSTESDLDDMLLVENKAFNTREESELVNNLLSDLSAKPLLSLMAFNEKRAIGHILFTRARLTNTDNPISAVILAPLAVVPEEQRKGVGGQLIEEGLRQLSESGIELVFVLGHPKYYPRHGFKPATALGFDAPHPIPAEYANAWMVQETRPGAIDSASGKIVCADTLNHPELWRP